MTSRHPPVSHIAGEIAASGKRDAADVAARIVARLAREGFLIVPADGEAGAVAALQALDAILDLRGAAEDEGLVREWAGQMGMDGPTSLMAAVTAVRDGPRNAEDVASYRAA